MQNPRTAAKAFRLASRRTDFCECMATGHRLAPVGERFQALLDRLEAAEEEQQGKPKRGGSKTSPRFRP